MTRPLTAGLIVIAFGALLTLGVPLAAHQEKLATADFAGKIILLQGKTQTITVEKAVLKQLGDRWFVGGKIIRNDAFQRELLVGATIWLPVAELERIVEFEDVEQMRKLLRNQQDN